jgi:enoyl-CoA hydratase/carnithine racemase
VEGAKFTTAHGRFNFAPEYGLSWLLPRLIGITHANDLLLSSRVFTTEEAMTMGFLNRRLPPSELMHAVYEYAQTLAEGCSPGSVRESKRQLYLDQHRSAAQSVEESERLLHEMAKQPDYKEGIAAWMEKRKPRWQ